MILEAVMLNVIKGIEQSFETDFKMASRYISAINGCVNHSLSKCLEVENKYLLMVNWETIEAHTIGFRQSQEYLEWKKILHGYYEPFPTVEHFETVFENKL